jgi:hypothetical protein
MKHITFYLFLFILSTGVSTAQTDQQGVHDAVEDYLEGLYQATPREIAILDVLDKTAVAKLTAQWGVDHFQLAKIDGKWMIKHILWQAHPISDDH